MSAPRFFLDSVEPDSLTIAGDDARHGVRALRLRPGEIITVSDGRGTVATARVAEAGVTLEAKVEERAVVAASRPRVTVYQSIPKHGRLEDAADALTQVGVDHIVPIAAARSIPRWDRRKADAHVRRLRAIVREASMQSRRAWLPAVGDVIRTGDIPGETIVLHEGATVRLSDALPEQAPERIALAAGPEGGFDPEEIEVLRANGCPIVTLGPAIFRSELAAVVAASVVAARYGTLG